MFWHILCGGFAAIIVFLWWRLTSVERGARRRDAEIYRLLDPVAEKLEDGAAPERRQVEEVARNGFLRPFLYGMLEHFQRLDLFPQEYCSEEAQAEAELAYWMMHPNELQQAPAAMELVERIVRRVGNREGRFYVFRYRMPQGHWAGDDWLLGVAGPFFDGGLPYSGTGAFSRCGDVYGEVQPHELVDWFVRIYVKTHGSWRSA